MDKKFHPFRDLCICISLFYQRLIFFFCFMNDCAAVFHACWIRFRFPFDWIDEQPESIKCKHRWNNPRSISPETYFPFVETKYQQYAKKTHVDFRSTTHHTQQRIASDFNFCPNKKCSHIFYSCILFPSIFQLYICFAVVIVAVEHFAFISSVFYVCVSVFCT